MFEYARATRTLEGLVPLRLASVSLRTGASAPEPFFAEYVGGDYFDLASARRLDGRFCPRKHARLAVRRSSC